MVQLADQSLREHSGDASVLTFILLVIENRDENRLNHPNTARALKLDNAAQILPQPYALQS